MFHTGFFAGGRGELFIHVCVYSKVDAYKHADPGGLGACPPGYLKFAALRLGLGTYGNQTLVSKMDSAIISPYTHHCFQSSGGGGGGGI